jgi:hypothetical protein
MRNANEMRTIANNYNAQFEINVADEVIDRKVEEEILKNAKKGEYLAVVEAETLSIAIRCAVHNGSEIVNRVKYKGVLERAKELIEANGYTAEIVGGFKVVIRWNIEE